MNLKNFSFSVRLKTWRIYLNYSIMHRKLFCILQVLFIAQRRKRYLYIILKINNVGEKSWLLFCSFQRILKFFVFSLPFLLLVRPQMSSIRFQNLVTALCCVNSTFLSSLCKTKSKGFCLPSELISKMISFGYMISFWLKVKSNGEKKSCIQFISPLDLCYSIKGNVSGNVLQSYPHLREGRFLSILWGFGKRDQKQVMWLFENTVGS